MVTVPVVVTVVVVYLVSRLNSGLFTEPTRIRSDCRYVGLDLECGQMRAFGFNRERPFAAIQLLGLNVVFVTKIN